MCHHRSAVRRTATPLRERADSIGAVYHVRAHCPMRRRLLPAMTVLELLPAPTGTGIVASGRGEGCGLAPVPLLRPAHDFGGRALALEQPGHDAHGLIDVVEEALEASAQVVEARLAVGRGEKAILGT